jgi:hypothetical protein
MLLVCRLPTDSGAFEQLVESPSSAIAQRLPKRSFCFVDLVKLLLILLYFWLSASVRIELVNHLRLEASGLFLSATQLLHQTQSQNIIPALLRRFMLHLFYARPVLYIIHRDVARPSFRSSVHLHL